MNNITEEIEASQKGEAQAADNGASPYSLTNLRDIISDIRLLVSQYSEFPTVCWDTKEMFIDSLITMLKRTNNQLPFYVEDLKQNKCIEAFCISSGQFRDDEFWTMLDRICCEMENKAFYQSLKRNACEFQSQLAEAETIVMHCNPIVFEKYFFRKKLDYSDGGVVKRFNLMLYEYHTPSVEKLREMQALAVIEALNKGVFDFEPTPSQQENDKVSQELQSGFLPCDFEITEEFRKAYTKFRRFAEKKDPMMILNYKRYGKYIQNHYYDFSEDQRYAIFELDNMLRLIHEEMVKLEPELANVLNDKVNGNTVSYLHESGEEMFHFVHPSLNDEEGWKIHNEVKRLVRRQSVPDICQYLKKLASEDKILLPLMPSMAYTELIRMGMPGGEGFSEKYFRNCYIK